MKEKVWTMVIIILVIIFLANCFSCGSCFGNGDGDGGRCRICGTQTNWTYKGGGYLCYSCDKKFYK